MSAVGMCTSIDSKGFLRARCESEGLARDCRMTDIDANGAFIECFVPPVSGSPVKLRFDLPNGRSVKADGVVARHEFKVGFHVAFTALSPRDRRELEVLAR